MVGLSKEILQFFDLGDLLMLFDTVVYEQAS